MSNPGVFPSVGPEPRASIEPSAEEEWRSVGNETGASGDAKSPPPHLRLGEAAIGVLETLQSAIWVFDIERKRMHWANAAALHIWNSDSLEQLLARDFSSDMSKATETRLLDYLDRFRRGETLGDRWTFYPRGSPTPVTVISRASGTVLEDGRLAMLFEAVTAEIDGVEAEKLRMTEVLRHTSNVITVLASDGRLLLQNPASLRAHGSLAEGDGLEKLIADFREPEIARAAIQRAIKGEEVNLNARIRTREGLAWHEVKVLATRDPVTRASCILVSETNIDELRAAQDKNLQLERDATEKRMAGGFAHEVRNALSGAKISLQGALGQRGGAGSVMPLPPGAEGKPAEAMESATLGQAIIDELQRIYEQVVPSLDEATADRMLDAMGAIHRDTERLDLTLQMALAAVERTLELTSSIMQLSRVGHERAGNVPVDVGALLGEIADTLREECASLGIGLALVTPATPLLVPGVESHFHSVFMNVIRNAKDALDEPAVRAKPNRTITVEASREPDTEGRPGGVSVVVADNGAGIPADVRAHIFEPFFTTKTDTGTGLGLSLVKRYLDLYGASLSVESEPGDHTRFSVRFPSRPDLVDQRLQPAGEALMDRSGFNEILRRRGGTPKDASGKPRVLVIDDDRGIREALRVELGTPYDVTLADSAIQGIAALDTKPAVILLDIKMRGEDGFYAFREIRKIDALVPIIFHSAYQDVKNPYEIMNVYKPFAYLTKGGDLRALHRQLELAIDYHQKHIATKTELSDKLKKMSEEVERLRALMKK